MHKLYLTRKWTSTHEMILPLASKAFLLCFSNKRAINRIQQRITTITNPYLKQMRGLYSKEREMVRLFHLAKPCMRCDTCVRDEDTWKRRMVTCYQPTTIKWHVSRRCAPHVGSNASWNTCQHKIHTICEVEIWNNKCHSSLMRQI